VTTQMLAQELLANFIHIGSRYFIVAGAIFILFYGCLKRVIIARKIQESFPRLKDYRRDIFYSLISIGIFSVVSYLTVVSLAPYHNLYRNIDDYGLPYYLFTFIWMFFLHDTYFYWSHRLMHHPKIYKHVHLTHHRATNPTPWSAYAFHPIEAIIEAGIVTVIAFSIPVHFTAINTYMLFQIGYNVYGHLGYEILPANTNRHWLGKWINTSVAHNMHHQYFKHNYGLWTTVWDRLMGTLSPDYDAAFTRTTLEKQSVKTFAGHT